MKYIITSIFFTFFTQALFAQEVICVGLNTGNQYNIQTEYGEIYASDSSGYEIADIDGLRNVSKDSQSILMYSEGDKLLFAKLEAEGEGVYAGKVFWGELVDQEKISCYTTTAPEHI